MNSRSASIVGDQEAAGSSSFAWCNRQWLSSQALTRRLSVRPKQAVFNHNLLWLPESNGYPLHTKNDRVCGGYGFSFTASATKIISGDSSRIGDRSKSPYCAVTWNPQRASRCSTSYRKKYRSGQANTNLS